MPQPFLLPCFRGPLCGHCRQVLVWARHIINGEPNQDDELPIIRGDAPPGMFTPRWEELHRTYGIERPRGELPEIVIYRMPREDGIFHLPTWDRHVVTPDLWPEELIDDITGWFDDLRGRWPEVEWWVHRIHGSSSSSRMAILQQRNYVLITRHDFETYDRNPHGLMELSFREPQLHTTVLPQMLNLPILRSFLAPLMGGIQTRLTLRASLNGITLDHRLIGVERGFYLLVNWLGNPHQVSQIEQVAISHTAAVASAPNYSHWGSHQFICAANPWYHCVHTGR